MCAGGKPLLTNLPFNGELHNRYSHRKQALLRAPLVVPERTFPRQQVGEPAMFTGPDCLHQGVDKAGVVPNHCPGFFPRSK